MFFLCGGKKNEPLPRLNPDPFKRARKGRWPANEAQGRTARQKRRRGYDVMTQKKLNLYIRLITRQSGCFGMLVRCLYYYLDSYYCTYTVEDKEEKH